MEGKKNTANGTVWFLGPNVCLGYGTKGGILLHTPSSLEKKTQINCFCYYFCCSVFTKQKKTSESPTDRREAGKTFIYLNCCFALHFPEDNVGGYCKLGRLWFFFPPLFCFFFFLLFCHINNSAAINNHTKTALFLYTARALGTVLPFLLLAVCAVYIPLKLVLA